MAKRDRREQRVLLLACGHEVVGASSAERKKWRSCRTMQRVSEVRDLVRGEIPDGPEVTSLKKRDDGLTVRHFSTSPTKQWWCRWCWGARPARPFVRHVRSMDEVFAGWDRHIVSGRHLEAAGTASDLADAFREVES